MRSNSALIAVNRLLQWATELQKDKERKINAATIRHIDNVQKAIDEISSILDTVKRDRELPVEDRSGQNLPHGLTLDDVDTLYTKNLELERERRILLDQLSSKDNQTSDKAESSDPDKPEKKKKKYNWKQILSVYRGVIKQYEDKKFRYSASYKCAEYIAKWFRIVDIAVRSRRDGDKEKFVFCPEKTSSIIPLIVLAVCYCIATDTMHELSDDFDAWERGVLQGNNPYHYPAYISSMRIGDDAVQSFYFEAVVDDDADAIEIYYDLFDSWLIGASKDRNGSDKDEYLSRGYLDVLLVRCNSKNDTAKPKTKGAITSDDEIL